jgi:DUF4097 and DUF4098 domain-containing protein YvlB
MRRAGLGIALLAIATTGASGCCDCALIRATREVSLTAPWQEYAKVVVQTRNGHVEITRGTADAAEITAKLSVGGVTLGEAEKRLDQMEVVAAADSGDPTALLVQLKCPRDWDHWSPGAELAVRVPAACAAEVTTDNGRICVYDVGAASLKTSNGRIRAERIEGNVDARTSNGRIVLRKVSGPCCAETSNGSIEIRAARGGGVDAHTSNGSIDVEAAPPPDASVSLCTSNGAIHAVLPATMTADIEAHTSLGDVDVDFGSASVQDLHHKRSRLRAQMNGGGGQITASTSLGSVTIKFD